MNESLLYYKGCRADGIGSTIYQIILAMGIASFDERVRFVFSPNDFNFNHPKGKLNELFTFENNLPKNVISPDSLPPEVWPDYHHRGNNVFRYEENLIPDLIKTYVNKLMRADTCAVEDAIFDRIITSGIESMRPFLRLKESRFSSEFINVGLHIRRGDVSYKDAKRDIANRIHSLEYYENIIKFFLLNPRKKPYKFHIYTQYIIDDVKNEKEQLQDLVQTYDIKLHMDEIEDKNTAFQHWSDLVNIDIVVPIKSEFSYTASFFNKNEVFYCGGHRRGFLPRRELNKWKPIFIN